MEYFFRKKNGTIKVSLPTDILKVARTIADLDGNPNIEIGHLSEAINFRNLDRDSWGVGDVPSFKYFRKYDNLKLFLTYLSRNFSPAARPAPL